MTGGIPSQLGNLSVLEFTNFIRQERVLADAGQETMMFAMRHDVPLSRVTAGCISIPGIPQIV